MLTVYCERLHGGFHRISRRLLQFTRVIARVVHVRRREHRREREIAWYATRLEHLQSKKLNRHVGICTALVVVKPSIDETITHLMRKRLSANVQ